MAKINLKLCPFCGSAATIMKKKVCRSMVGNIVTCSNLDCRARTETCYHESEAIGAWNSRFNPEHDKEAEAGL